MGNKKTNCLFEKTGEKARKQKLRKTECFIQLLAQTYHPATADNLEHRIKKLDERLQSESDPVSGIPRFFE